MYENRMEDERAKIKYAITQDTFLNVWCEWNEWCVSVCVFACSCSQMFGMVHTVCGACEKLWLAVISLPLYSLLTLACLFSSHRPTQSLSIQFRFHCILLTYYTVYVCVLLVPEKDHTDFNVDRELASDSMLWDFHWLLGIDFSFVSMDSFGV